MTRDEFLALDKFSVIRRLGVSYRLDDQWTLPGANYGNTTLTAYRQSPTWKVCIHPNNTEWLRQAHYIGDWKTQPELRQGHGHGRDDDRPTSQQARRCQVHH